MGFSTETLKFTQVIINVILNVFRIKKRFIFVQNENFMVKECLKPKETKIMVLLMVDLNAKVAINNFSNKNIRINSNEPTRS